MIFTQKWLIFYLHSQTSDRHGKPLVGTAEGHRIITFWFILRNQHENGWKCIFDQPFFMQNSQIQGIRIFWSNNRVKLVLGSLEPQHPFYYWELSIFFRYGYRKWLKLGFCDFYTKNGWFFEIRKKCIIDLVISYIW